MNQRRIARRRETYEALLAATHEVASREGWRGVTIRKIAAEVQMTSAAIYRYVDAKEDLIQELVSRGFSALTDSIRVASLTGADPLSSSILAYLRFAAESPDLYHAMFGLGGAGFPPPAPEHATLLGYIFADALVRTQHLSIPDPNHPRVVALWACVHGLVGLHSAGRLSLPPDELLPIALSTFGSADS